SPTEAFFLARPTPTQEARTAVSVPRARSAGRERRLLDETAGSVPRRGRPLAKGFEWVVRARRGSQTAARPDASTSPGAPDTRCGARTTGKHDHGAANGRPFSRCGQTYARTDHRAAAVVLGIERSEGRSWFRSRGRQWGARDRDRLERGDPTHGRGAAARTA